MIPVGGFYHRKVNEINTQMAPHWTNSSKETNQSRRQSAESHEKCQRSRLMLSKRCKTCSADVGAACANPKKSGKGEGQAHG
ncbi:MAG: hypothetical protein IPO69_16065 [Saprospiraceae bacterium]|nr:hypothetical protein [Saprospiraceae bacterium]